MPTSSPLQPKLQRGAVVAYPGDRNGSVPSMVPFQYNPESVRRALVRSTASDPDGEGADASPQAALRVAGPAEESITIAVRLDAADLKESAGAFDDVTRYGLLPALAVLETLLSPSLSVLEDARRRADRGQAAPIPFDLPLTLLVLGQNRVLPVKLTTMDVEETLHDPGLNPLVAHVTLTLSVLGGRELRTGGLGHLAFKAHLRQTELLAAKRRAGAAAGYLRGMLP